MESSLIDQGVSLMLYGMGTVFVFLTILVFATNLMSKIVNRFSPSQPVPASASASASASAPKPNDLVATGQTLPSASVIAAIEKAVAEHRAQK